MRNGVLVALAGWGSMAGTVEELATRLGMPTDEVRACVLQMADQRLVAVQIQPGAHLTIRPERRAAIGPAFAVDL